MKYTIVLLISVLVVACGKDTKVGDVRCGPADLRTYTVRFPTDNKLHKASVSECNGKLFKYQDVNSKETIITRVFLPYIEPDTSCRVYDACTYTHNGLSKTPVYNCIATTYQADDHREIDLKYYDGQPCFTTYEDYHSEQTLCSTPFGPQPCVKQVQGPGPLAIPEIGI